MSLRRCQQEVDSAEFSEWLAYNEIEPFGEERADLRSGIIAATVANACAKPRDALSPKDFMPDFRRSKAGPMTVEEMQARLAITANLKPLPGPGSVHG